MTGAPVTATSIDEILDLVAYVLSGGDKANAMFGK